MFVLQYVEQKEKQSAGDQMGWALPISSFGSRHYSGVATGKAWCAQ